MKKNKNWVIVGFIFFLAFLIRVWDLQNNPPGFFADEADIGYSAYQLIKTGKVEGQNIVFYSPSLGVYRPTVSIFAATLPISFLGLNHFSARIMPVLVGAATTILVYLLMKELFRTSTIPYLSSLLLAISPWHIHFSRSGFEYIYYPFFFTLGLYLLVKGFKGNSWFFILGFFFFGLTLYTYHPAILQTSLFVFGLSIFFLKKVPLKKLAVGWFIFFLISLPLLNGIKTGKTTGRFQEISILKAENLSFGKKMLQAGKVYTSQFSPIFLFQKGDIDYPTWNVTRHSVRGTGELYLWQSIFIFLGILSLVKTSSDNKVLYLILLFWLLIYPLGNALTFDTTPHANRTIIGVIPFQILTAIGLVYFLKFCSKYLSKASLYLLISIIFLTATTSFLNYFRSYLVEYPSYAADYWGWQYGPEQIVKYFIKTQANYDELYLTGSFNAPGIFLKFYDPEHRCKNCAIGALDQYNPEKKQLFAMRPDEVQLSSNIKIKEQVYYPSGNVAFIIFEIIKNE